MKALTKTLIFITLLILLPTKTKAQDLWLKNIPLAKLEALYKEVNYAGYPKDHLLLDDRKYPRIFLKNIPLGFEKITDETKRNNLFLKILIPLALKLNEDIMIERKKLLKLQEKIDEGKNFSKQDIDYLEKLAKEYDLFTTFNDDIRHNYFLAELQNRVDRIPPSIIVTAAIIETNWGASRIVKEGNSLYKILEWHTTEGLKPIGENEDNSYRIKIYPDLYSSIKDYALKVNSAPSFEKLRNLRREYRELNNNMVGHILAPYTFGSSNLHNYPGIFDYTLAYYELLEIDKSILTDKIISDSIIKKYQPYTVKNKKQEKKHD
ncbi:MAG: glucosaminidase domain-containing protein [Alphaproteobacteria bacterium]|nr:glucosaminidase domain-containing protein [Alphaproteobacteria bacterium]